MDFFSGTIPVFEQTTQLYKKFAEYVFITFHMSAKSANEAMNGSTIPECNHANRAMRGKRRSVIKKNGKIPRDSRAIKTTYL